MKNLNILTHAAQRSGKKKNDRRRLPRCPICRRAVLAVPGNIPGSEYCYSHASDAERAHYHASWTLYLDGANVPVEEDPR